VTPSGPPVSLLIFDCDGVLIDSEPIACGAVADGLRAIGIEISTQEVITRYAGISAPVMFDNLEAQFGVAISNEQRMHIQADTNKRLFASVQPISGVVNVLSSLSSTYLICVASSSAPTRITMCLSKAGLAHFFGHHVYSASQVRAGKPAPDLFLHAAIEMKVGPTHCVVIEDSTAGVTAARAAGMRALGFWGAGHGNEDLKKKLLACGATQVFSQMAALPGLLSGLAA
jgi:HAD superfamily hydrolase (TIGR01509 family)